MGVDLLSFLSFHAKRYSPKNCAEAIGRAKESVKIVVPDFNVDFVYNKIILDALKRAVEKDVLVQVAVPPMGLNNIGILRVPGIQIFDLKREAKRLVMIIDSKHVLAERALSKLRHVDVGMIIGNVDTLAHEFDTQFDELVERIK